MDDVSTNAEQYEQNRMPDSSNLEISSDPMSQGFDQEQYQNVEEAQAAEQEEVAIPSERNTVANSEKTEDASIEAVQLEEQCKEIRMSKFSVEDNGRIATAQRMKLMQNMNCRVSIERLPRSATTVSNDGHKELDDNADHEQTSPNGKRKNNKAGANGNLEKKCKLSDTDKEAEIRHRCKKSRSKSSRRSSSRLAPITGKRIKNHIQYCRDI